jgi:hypothetical protein
MSHSARRHLATLTLLAIAAYLLIPIPAVLAASQDDSAFSMTVPGVRSLSVDTNTIYFTPDVTQLLAGWTTEETLITTVNANVDWVLTITGSQSNWTGPWSKPVGDIYWKYGAGDYAALTTLAANVATDGPVDGGSYPISFKIALNLAIDVPGEYSYQYVVLELAAP